MLHLKKKKEKRHQTCNSYVKAVTRNAFALPKPFPPAHAEISLRGSGLDVMALHFGDRGGTEEDWGHGATGGSQHQMELGGDAGAA